MASVSFTILKSFVATVLKGTFGLLVKKSGRYVADKLKDGDVVDQKVRSWIVREMEKISLKLDAEANSDLESSLSFLKEGIVILNTVLGTEISDEGGEAERSLQFDSNTSCLSEEMKNLQISDLKDSERKALLPAQKRFSEARNYATKAFNNTSLSPYHRVLAMNFRLRATILELSMENLKSASAVCRECLKELHLMPEIKANLRLEITKSFKSRFGNEERKQIISAVCEVNRAVYNVTRDVGDEKDLLLWPCIEVDNEKVDPLRDSRVAETLRELGMSNCSLVRTFGQQEVEEHQKLKSATSIAVNSLGHLLVVDESDDCIKVFDTTGRFLSSFRVPRHESDRPHTSGRLQNIATDRNDNVYVLTVTEKEERKTTSIGTKLELFITNDIFLFDEKYNLLHKFHFSQRSFTGCFVRVIRDHSLFLGLEEVRKVTPSQCLLDPTFSVCICKMRDESRAYRTELLVTVQTYVDKPHDVMIVDDCVMLLNSEGVSAIRDYQSNWNAECIVNFLRQNSSVCACAIAYHDISEQIVVVSHPRDSEIPSLVLIYNKEGNFNRSIHLEVDKKYSIKGVSVTRDGLIYISADLGEVTSVGANLGCSPHGKVFVL